MSKENNKIKYPRGSEWRKWDLHIHSDTGSPDQIVNKLIEKKISVFSITDHCNVDRIDVFSELAEQKQKENIEILFLPGIELRTDKGKKSVHLVGIFPLLDKDGNQINSDYLKQNLLSQIGCNDTDIINAGKEVLGEGKTDTEYKKRGYLEKVVSFENAANQIKKLGGLTIVHAGTKSSGIETEMKHAKSEDEYELLNSLGHTKRILIKKYISVCELSNWNDSNLKERDFYLKTFDKPSIVCSDSHSLSNIGTRYTWIKADPTFEGLKQILYEPELRIFLGEKPELYLYPQIHSIQLKGVEYYQTKKDKTDFPPINLDKRILFNPNLTNIIGPRASGKTVLVELLSYPFDVHQKRAKKNANKPLAQFLNVRFPNLSILVAFQQGEKDIEYIERKITDLSDPYYSPPLLIEYWTQGRIEEVAEKKEKITDYMKDRLSSSLLASLSEDIDKLELKLKDLRPKNLKKFETTIEQKKLIAERKQLENYFEKLKTREYLELIEKIRSNRKKIQFINSLKEVIKLLIESLEESKQKIDFSEIPRKQSIEAIFAKNTKLNSQINDFYRFIETDLSKSVERFKTLIESISTSKEQITMSDKEVELKQEFLEYCEKNGIKITKSEYEKRTKRLEIINQKLRETEAKLREYNEAKTIHNELIQDLQKKLKLWKVENKRIIKEFNFQYSNSDISIIWEDPKINLSEWVKKQFLGSDSDTKSLIYKHYHISSPVREDFVRGIVEELIKDKGYSLEKIIEYLTRNKLPPLLESRGKEENLKWFFQREETNIVRENLIMRLKEYAERGSSLIQYKSKILGKDNMSFGERCGTLVELILHSGDHPLIIDQPEEHLDAKFIANRVVEIIKKQKVNRQIIICTHNANIVVLGDSELTTALSMSNQGTKYYQGSLEEPVIREKIYDVLEGGRIAFQKRERKYGFK